MANGHMRSTAMVPLLYTVFCRIEELLKKAAPEGFLHCVYMYVARQADFEEIAIPL